MKRRQELPIVSGILVAANVIVYLICTFTGNLLYNIGELDAAASRRVRENHLFHVFACRNRSSF